MIFDVFDISPLTLWINCCFYRMMHYSAKRGLAIACHLSVRQTDGWTSVRLSVTLVDHDHIG